MTPSYMSPHLKIFNRKSIDTWQRAEYLFLPKLITAKWKSHIKTFRNRQWKYSFDFFIAMSVKISLSHFYIIKFSIYSTTFLQFGISPSDGSLTLDFVIFLFYWCESQISNNLNWLLRINTDSLKPLDNSNEWRVNMWYGCHG